jgi:hypothetical protein
MIKHCPHAGYAIRNGLWGMIKHCPMHGYAIRNGLRGMIKHWPVHSLTRKQFNFIISNKIYYKEEISYNVSWQ